ncbi:hypothetical protein DPMN_029247 [Dreissena polymorpha]|uniref:Uncharacterized protein n=1 Tax=Dreissena polymorpha TaxID=45954 RepID=A0A9D4RH75_DREPO|nr:hypothetical protein DPMN_029247 [Dreissena polymorpha]
MYFFLVAASSIELEGPIARDGLTSIKCHVSGASVFYFEYASLAIGGCSGNGQPYMSNHSLLTIYNITCNADSAILTFFKLSRDQEGYYACSKLYLNDTERKTVFVPSIGNTDVSTKKTVNVPPKSSSAPFAFKPSVYDLFNYIPGVIVAIFAHKI